jgi:hypothetical protein
VEDTTLNRLADAFNRIAEAINRHTDVAEATEQRISERAKQAQVLKDDGREAEAVELLKTNSTLSSDRVVGILKTKGIIRNRPWVLAQRTALGLPVGRQQHGKGGGTNHRGLKMKEADYHADGFPDESAMAPDEIKTREAFAIDAIRQNPNAEWAALYIYMREHVKCGLDRTQEWIESHRG